MLEQRVPRACVLISEQCSEVPNIRHTKHPLIVCSRGPTISLLFFHRATLSSLAFAKQRMNHGPLQVRKVYSASR